MQERATILAIRRWRGGLGPSHRLHRPPDRDRPRQNQLRLRRRRMHPGVERPSETFNVTLELLRCGYTEKEIGKIWSGNLLRVNGGSQEGRRGPRRGGRGLRERSGCSRGFHGVVSRQSSRVTPGATPPRDVRASFPHARTVSQQGGERRPPQFLPVARSVWARGWLGCLPRPLPRGHAPARGSYGAESFVALAVR